MNIGRLSIRDLSQTELKKFFIFQYKIVAKIKDSEISSKNHKNAKENGMDAVMIKGKVMEDKGKYEEAIKIYSAIDETNINYSEFLARIGNCYMRLQDLEKAENNYRKSLEFGPEGYAAEMGLGLLELQINNFNDAINRFGKITKLKPDSDKAWSALGIAYRKANRIMDSMNAFSQALEINVENDAAMSNLLELSYQQNFFSQIEAAFNKYLEINPVNENLLFGLAGIQYKSKRFDDSQKTLDKILALNPENTDAIRMMDKITAYLEKTY